MLVKAATSQTQEEAGALNKGWSFVGLSKLAFSRELAQTGRTRERVREAERELDNYLPARTRGGGD